MKLLCSLVFLVGSLGFLSLLGGCEDTAEEEKNHILNYALGQVLANNQPVEGVIIKSNIGDYQLETITDIDGRFRLQVFIVNKTSSVDVELYIANELIGVIVIDATKDNIIHLEEFDFFPENEYESVDNELSTRSQALNFGCIERVLKQALRYRDPLNHCYAACELRRTCGVSAYGTIVLSWAKEICDILNWTRYCHDFSVGDLWADFKGLTCSYKTWQSCYRCCPK